MSALNNFDVFDDFADKPSNDAVLSDLPTTEAPPMLEHVAAKSAFLDGGKKENRGSTKKTFPVKKS